MQGVFKGEIMKLDISPPKNIHKLKKSGCGSQKKCFLLATFVLWSKFQKLKGEYECHDSCEKADFLNQNNF